MQREIDQKENSKDFSLKNLPNCIFMPYFKHNDLSIRIVCHASIYHNFQELERVRRILRISHLLRIILNRLQK